MADLQYFQSSRYGTGAVRPVQFFGEQTPTYFEIFDSNGILIYSQIGINFTYSGGFYASGTEHEQYYFDSSGNIVFQITNENVDVATANAIFNNGGTSYDYFQYVLRANDNLIGSDFDDKFAGSNGSDSFDGGLGSDLLSFNGYGQAVTVNLATGTAITTSGTSTIVNVEDVEGTRFNDTLTGNSGANQLQGFAGDDRLDGGTGIDTAVYLDAAAAVNVSLVTGTATGGSGSDTLISIERVVGSRFNDTLVGSSGNESFLGGFGNDSIDGGAGFDTVEYNLVGSAVTVNLISGTTSGGAGIDSLTRVEGIIGSLFGDTLTGNAEVNHIFAGNGNDVVRGGAGNDLIYGEAGNDTLAGDAGNDLIEGGAGSGDTVDYSQAAAAVTVNLVSQVAQNTVGAGTDTIHGVENVTGSAFNDLITGNEFDNIVTAGAGNDTIVGGLGNDTLNGGAGIDSVNYAAATAGVKVSLAIATAQATVGAGNDTIAGIETLNGSAFDDMFTGDAGANVLTGNAGNDTLQGGLGNDTLSGGLGLDTASYAEATAGVTVNLALTTAQNTIGAGTDILSTLENLTGSAFGDSLTGSSLANLIAGGNGGDAIDGGSGNDIVDGGTDNDMLKGGAGDDLITGGTGDDMIDGGTNIDTISYAAAGAGVTASLALTSGQNVGGGLGLDTIVNVENILGSAFADTLTGSAVVNVLTGGAGKDMLAGGAGNDRFVYLTTGDSRVGATADRIIDFTMGDILDLSAIDANSKTVSTNEAFTQVGAFSSVAGQFTLAFNGGTNITTLLGDTDGNGTADFSVLFTGDVTALTGTWIL